MKRSILLLLILGACVSAPKTSAPPMVVAQPAPPPPPLPQVAWQDRTRTPGNWSYRRENGRSVAKFANDAGVSVFTVTCDGDHVTLYRPGPEALVMTITTTTLSLRLLGSPDSLTHGAVGTVRANDPLLDAIIYSRGKFMVSATGLPDLILPPWPEIARVVENCRD